MNEEVRGYAEIKSVDTMVEKSWGQGKIVAYATVGEGPAKGHQIMVVGDREEMEALLREMMIKPPTRTIGSNLRAAVRASVRRLGKLSPEEHQDLMNDIQLLLSLHLVDPENIGTLTGAGLVSLALAVHENASLPWHKRGMLDPELLRLLGVTTEIPKTAIN